MSPIDIILASAVALLTMGHIGLFFVTRTYVERAENKAERALKYWLEQKEQPGLNDMSSELVELHRKLTQLQTVVENQGLRLTDIADTLEHRFNRLRMRQQRAKQEGEDEEPEVDEETQMQLLQDLNGGQVPETQQPARRGRLVAKYRRDKYTRR